MMIYLLSVIG